jgi:hypothetical protein
MVSATASLHRHHARALRLQANFITLSRCIRRRTTTFSRVVETHDAVAVLAQVNAENRDPH